METIRRAVIDVGTNSVKLLVADVAGHEVQPVCEQSKQTRLGHGFYETHRLRAEAIAATANAVAAFAAIAREAQAASVCVIATSAAREAANREELTSAIEYAAGLKVEVISGDQEADWGFKGVTTDPQLAQAPLLLLDVGGGSTQFTLGSEGHTRFRYSFPIGSVRLLETIPCSDPPKRTELAACRQWLKDFLRKEVRPKLVQELGNSESGLETEQSLRNPNSGKQGDPADDPSPALKGTLPMNSCEIDGPLSLSLSPSKGEKVPKAGEGAVQGSKARPSIRGILSPSEGERDGMRGLAAVPVPAPVHAFDSGFRSLLTSAATGTEGGVQLVGVGGAATILGCMEAKLQAFDRARIEAICLSAERVSWHLQRLWSLPLEARKETIGLPKNRADVILMGVAVYQGVMEEFGFRELRVSTRGLRFAAVMD